MPVIAPLYRGPSTPPLEVRQELRASAPTAFQSLLPSQLDELVEGHCEALIAERPPQSHLQKIFIRQVARHAGALDLAAAAEGSVLRLAESNAAAYGSVDEPDGADARRVAAMNTDALQRLSKYRTGHERALYAAVRHLTREPEAPLAMIPANLFQDEENCLQHVYRWQCAQDWQCESCGGKKRCWMKSRTKFECACGKQFSVRLGTVYYQSHVPLLVWFTVVTRVLTHGSITAAALARDLNMTRQTTIARMIKTVHAALDSPHPDRQLADVDQIVLAHLRQARG